MSRARLNALLLVAAVPLLLWTGEVSLLLFPVSLQVAANPGTAALYVDGQLHVISVARPLVGVQFPPVAAYHREYQVDGSDSTNSFTFQPEYFARFGTSAYYRLQAFLRDDSSYSRWDDLMIRGPSGQLIWTASHPTSRMLIPLPTAFQLSVDLHRIETPRSIEFLEAGGGRLAMELNRNNRYVSVIETIPGGADRELGHWYFPMDWRPPFAEVAWLWLRAVAIGITLILVVAAITAVLPGFSVHLPERNLVAAAAVLAAGALLLAAGFSSILFDRVPHIFDAVSYYFQAKTFASGALTAPAPPVRQAFPTPFFVVHGGRWFSQYPPGTAAVLALGFLARLPWLVEPAFAAGGVLLTYGLARRQFGTITGLLTATLMATSPFLALQAASFLSHVPAMFFAALLLYAVTRYFEAPALRWAALGTVALGLLFLTREIAALLVGLPVVVMAVFRTLRSPTKRWAVDAVVASGVLLSATVIYLSYNWAITGSAFELPRHLLSAADRLGFGPGIGFYGRHTLAAGFVNMDQLLTSLNISLFGWPFAFSLALMVLPFLTHRPKLWEALHGTVVALFIGAHVAYFYHGIAFGPRYYFEALPSMAILTARGFVVLAGASSALLRSLGFSIRRAQAEKTAIGLLAVLLACNLGYFLPRQASLYRNYSGMPGGDGPVPVGFVKHDIEGRKPTLQNALITTTNPWIYTEYLAALNCPRLDCPSVFALAPNVPVSQQLASAFPGRRHYLVEPQDGHLTAVPAEAP